jgi:HlyB family type I secretion system ABC transporter
MVQNSFVPIDREQLAQILGTVPENSDFIFCLKNLEIQRPDPGQKFWQSSSVSSGVYIVLAGKVRLVNEDKELVETLNPGDCFGENTIFTKASFLAYSARASIDVRIGYLSIRLLKKLAGYYHVIENHLYRRAVELNWLFLCPEIAALHKQSGFRRAISLLQRHNLPIGNLPDDLKDKKLWLLRKGEMLSTTGNLMQDGSIYTPQFEDDSWQITQSTEIYTLNESQWQEVLSCLPSFAQLIYSNNLSAETESLNNNSGEIFENTAIQSQILDKPRQQTKLTNTSSKVKGRKISQAYFPSPTLQMGHLWQRVTRHYPFFQQQSASDCGVASLIMVGQYWGKRFSVNRLREISGVDRNGASLKGLVLAAESIGFTTRPVKTNLKGLVEQALPAIVHWEGKHYIVVYQTTPTQIIVCDPAIGQRTLTYTEFEIGWTGHTLLLQPTALLKNAEESSIPFWQFIDLVKPHRVVLIEIFFASVMIQIFGLVTPVFTQLLLDRVVVQRSTLTLNAIGLGLLIFGLFKVAMTGLRQYLLDHVANRVDISLIVGFISHTLKLPLSYFESRYVGDIISRVQENRKIQQFMTGETLSIVLDLLTMFVYAGLMFWYSWKLALLVLVIVPPFIILALFATPFLRRISREIFAASNEQTKYLIQSLTGIRTVKALAVEQTVRWHWEELFGKSVKKTFSGQVISNILSISSSTINTLVTTALLWFGVWQVIHDELTIGQLVAFNMLMGNVISPFQRLTFVWNELQEIIIAIERINDVIDTEPEENLQVKLCQSLPPIQGQIKFDRVSFRYQEESDHNILENISFEIQPGQTVALVGRSGSGKTTLSKLCLGFYLPTEGQIFFDGYDLASLSLGSLRQQIGVVDQDSFLFGGTIRENISIAYPEADLKEVMDAATSAGAHEFIKELPMGYETQIGEGGGMLSGGQKQRLAIARALMGNPRLLILDEATSHLDTESERIIQANFERILRERTTLVIAHRLSTIRNADLILVLNKGVLIESGNHEELMADHGQYYYLNQQQFSTVG